MGGKVADYDAYASHRSSTNLGAHLQQPKWELVVGKGRDEKSETRIHSFL